jgi:hypothetical protein
MRRFALLLLATGCGQDVAISASAQCDGEAQKVETTVDAPFDFDHDGYFDARIPDCAETYDASLLDCDDSNPDIHPGVAEVACDDLDNDCDEATVDNEDLDGDGVGFCDDCDDTQSAAYPGATEVPCDGIDNDCDLSSDDGVDADGDGVNECDDCDDLDVGVFPGNTEIACNDVDDDCDASTLDGVDLDLDGVDGCEEDCDDEDDTVRPGVEEVCDDEVDNDCDGDVDEDCTYTGTYTLDSTITYKCAFGYVNISFDELTVVDTYPVIQLSAKGSQPGTMTGEFSSATEFAVENLLTGSCDEDYTVEGTFTDKTTFVGTFTAAFTGSCFDCDTTSWTITGTL